MRHERSLNPNKKPHREKIAEKCEQMLDIINIEKELQEVNGNFSQEKIKKLDEDITHMLRKARKHAKGKTTSIEKSTAKSKLQSKTSFWRLMLSEK